MGGGMGESDKPPRRSAKRARCAIYTRKSSEEGLEQAFNSLDAQREACAAFMLSQKHEGWTVSPALYDDGGFSGGTMERPALKRLIADIEARQVDVVVVYKVDRLTRALSDFAKLVDVFDRRGVSFVSITQQFNTTTSMGRLTLNVLLSFAQFEREVTGERIRDKVAASKKKGMWMGGMPPLGYDVKNRKLAVNDEEAASLSISVLSRAQVRARAAGRACRRRDQEQAPHAARRYRIWGPDASGHRTRARASRRGSGQSRAASSTGLCRYVQRRRRRGDPSPRPARTCQVSPPGSPARAAAKLGLITGGGGSFAGLAIMKISARGLRA
jgi:DNA invertase Pin-like site-specific DNA recombinase